MWNIRRPPPSVPSSGMTNVIDTDAKPRVRLQPPPPALMRVLNVVVRRVLRTPALGRRMTGKGVLEFVGRRSGRRLRVPVCLHHVDGETLVLTKRAWRLNFAGGAPLVVTTDGRQRSGRATLLDAAPAQVGHAVRAALDSGATPFDLGLKMPRRCDPTEAELAALPLGIIRIDVDTEDPDEGP